MPKRFSRILSNKVLNRYRMASGKQRGFGLVESLIAVAILGSAVFMLLNGLTTGYVSVGIVKENTFAENLGRTQLEYTKSLPYSTAPYSYQSVDEIPAGYSVTAEASAISGKDDSIQKITITVYHGSKQVYTIESFKVNR